MQKHLLEYLDARKEEGGEAFRDDRASLSFRELYEKSRRIGSFLAKRTEARRPVAVLSAKSVETPPLFFGALWAGCYYVPLGAELPPPRLKLILDIVKPALLLTDGSSPDLIASLGFSGEVVGASEAAACETDEAALSARVEGHTDADPAYVVFTSGSSGRPKGVVTSHRSVIDYVDAFSETFGITGRDVIASQAPLDYVAAVRDLYLPLKTGAKTVLLAKSLFSMPARLMERVESEGCTLLPWVSSALSLCAELRVFGAALPRSVRTVFFTGSVLPPRHLRYWQEALPGTVFVNHYGPTEITASCSYHIFDHIVAGDEPLPIGKPFRNTRMFLLPHGENDPDGGGTKGEICVGGSCLALGYFGDPEESARVFTDNPLNSAYREPIYRTGDVGSVGPDGSFYFHGRKDFQIKHMGHRIELSEIENACLAIEGVTRCACVYDEESLFIWLFYVGSASARDLSVALRATLPAYMIPKKFVSLDSLPVNAGGKTDYQALKAAARAGKAGA